ncbi:NAD(P)-binding protein [Obba rivulosa]|uniref:NAD(P)-binding protein n=1 Tax=Obba rivulosa TaxID=1052685 RepID=A0A8E2ARY2_9APHY|nr:NAD(P)-binding protein [Obba rivulosa]
MSNSNSLILVTGASGFLGSTVVHQLLEAGYRVRGTVRSSKVDFVQEAWAEYKDRFEAYGLDDLIAGDFSGALQGVSGVIHTAAPLAGRQTPEEALQVAVEGSLNVLRQAEKVGITKFVYVSSIVTVCDIDKLGGPGGSDQTWNSVTREQAVAPNVDPMIAYAAEKKFSELAVWDFAEKHPNVDITSLNPPFFYGPFAPGFRAPEAKFSVLSTNGFIYRLLMDGQALSNLPAWVDVRDVARACVLGLTSPPASEVDRKRLLLSGEWWGFRQGAEYLAQVRPELRGRINKAAWTAPPPPKCWVDNSRAKEVLGLEITPWQESLVAAVDSLINLEKEWASKGLTPK